jgi:hypothetical protein
MDYTADPFGDPWRDLPEKVPSATLQQREVEVSATAEPDGTAQESASDMEDESAAIASPPRGRSVLQAVPALRPMGSWLGRHANSDRPDLDG